ncbi:hypothetical protein HJG60_008064 [Phyllostomus discolor]|uniref:Uncharacterized protein n=1 Tax=Phyllostomus discolor TaxID=89673 RepID=A0A834EVY9_9CHIR|nr:hypothetical protein HJG60_008064 [Phyllostomus discolor]
MCGNKTPLRVPLFKGRGASQRAGVPHTELRPARCAFVHSFIHSSAIVCVPTVGQALRRHREEDALVLVLKENTASMGEWEKRERERGREREGGRERRKERERDTDSGSDYVQLVLHQRREPRAPQAGGAEGLVWASGALTGC